MTDIVDRLRSRCEGYTFGPALADLAPMMKDAADEIERLRERLGPVGLEVVMLAGRGHYVNIWVKAEIERLRKLVAATERDLEKALAALDHHMKADR